VAPLKVFLGSSTEQRQLVEWLTDFMRRDYAGRLEPVPWTTPWPGGRYTLENLLGQVSDTDASILFWTADDKTWYRNTEVHEPRDNLTFEAGLFIATHGRERTQLLVPQYEPGDPRRNNHMPSDLNGLTYNPYQWVDGDPQATGLPRTARVVCDNLVKLGPRLRERSLAETWALDRSKVEEFRTIIGDWFTLNTGGIGRLAAASGAREIDILVAYRVGEIRRYLDGFRQRKGARLRACFANMWDSALLSAYQRKYFDRNAEQIRNGLRESIEFLMGGCTVNVQAPDQISLTNLQAPPAATYDLRLTSQRITFGYYRIDQTAFIVPLDMKKAQDPSPLVWVLTREVAARAFDHYLEEYNQMFEEALHVFPGR
jgi:hypothetical protein